MQQAVSANKRWDLGSHTTMAFFSALRCSNVRGGIAVPWLAAVVILGERMDVAGPLAVSVFIHNHQKSGLQLPMDRKLLENWSVIYAFWTNPIFSVT